MTSEDVREYFEYRDGGLYWKKSSKSKAQPGDKFGCLDDKGYIRGRFKGKSVREHRLVWLYFNDTLPTFLDHADGNRSNNKIENLREATFAENMRNTSLRQDSELGHKGVRQVPSGRYVARIRVDGKRLHLGTFEDLELACRVADEARDLYHGKYARNK